MTSFADLIPSPEARQFVEIIHRENPDPRVGAWFAMGLIQGEWEYAGESQLKPSTLLQGCPQPRVARQVESYQQERMI